MYQTLTTRLSAAAALAVMASGSIAANVPIDVASASNGLTRIFSVTFDEPHALLACGGSSTAYCTFFGGDPSTSVNITESPNPSGVLNNVPGGIGPGGIPVAPVPASGSFLDLKLHGNNTSVTLGVSSITFAPVDICITAADGCTTVSVHAVDAGMVFNPTGPANGGAFTPGGGGSTGATVPIDGSRKAVFEVQNGGAVVVDFSRFSQVVGTSCTGSSCALITGDILNLDIVRYVLEIQFDATFTSFTGNFIGQSSNNSLLFVTLNTNVADADGDGVAGASDNCPLVAQVNQADSDSDGRGNMCDNCSGVANNTGASAQCDSDGDDFGNRCDGDLSGNNATNTQDYGLFRQRLGQASTPPTFNAGDMNCNGAVNTQDYGLFRPLLGSPPGPGAGP